MCPNDYLAANKQLIFKQNALHFLISYFLLSTQPKTSFSRREKKPT